MEDDEFKINEAIKPHLFELATPDRLDSVRSDIADALGIHPDSVAATILEDSSVKIDIPGKSFVLGITIPFS
jgi:hypothetical protein